MNFRWAIAVLFIAAIPCATMVKPIRSEESKDSLTVDLVLGWLPVNTETVTVTRGPFKIEQRDENIATERSDLGKELEETSQWLQKAGSGSLGKLLNGQTVSLVVEGSRGFRPPKGLGLMPYDGCHVIVFQNNLGHLADAFRKAIKPELPKTLEIAALPVMTIEEKLEEDRWKLYIAQPQSNVLLLATDKAYLEEVIRRMRKPGKSRALPLDLPEWKYVNTKAKYWAVRHYDKSNAAKDPSTPLTTEERPANHPDPQAIGLVFQFDPQNEKAVRLKYLSTNRNILQNTSKAWTYEKAGLTPQFRQLSPEVVEIIVNDPKATRTFLLLLLMNLGHGIYL